MKPANRRDLWRNVPSNLAPAVVAMTDMVHDGIAMPDLAPGAEILIHTVEGEEPAHLDDGPALSEAGLEEAHCGAADRKALSSRVSGAPGKLALAEAVTVRCIGVSSVSLAMARNGFRSTYQVVR
nr:hypothetical protein [Gordonia metallireducens]